MKEIYYYKGKPYTILAESKIKLSGIIDLPEIEVTDVEVGADWVDVIVYECEYDNPDGKIWVRTRKQFFELFTKSLEDWQ
jgi:hypothetical protein